MTDKQYPHSNAAPIWDMKPDRYLTWLRKDKLSGGWIRVYASPSRLDDRGAEVRLVIQRRASPDPMLAHPLGCMVLPAAGLVVPHHAQEIPAQQFVQAWEAQTFDMLADMTPMERDMRAQYHITFVTEPTLN